ncbi:MAG: hypothetical protein IKN48_02515 [Bacteroidaceae bacterium]|nr:hypothetical protein [Bacteroidaceae bacterium]
MRRLLYIIIGVVLLGMISCRSVQEVEHVRWHYVDRWHTDSIYIHDTDSVFVKQEQKNDTIRIVEEKWKIRERIREVRDTLTVMEHDTIVITHTELVEKRLTPWQQAQMKVGYIAIILLGGVVAVWLYGIYKKYIR